MWNNKKSALFDCARFLHVITSAFITFHSVPVNRFSFFHSPLQPFSFFRGLHFSLHELAISLYLYPFHSVPY